MVFRLVPAKDKPLNIEVVHREKDWSIRVTRPMNAAIEEVWASSIICL